MTKKTNAATLLALIMVLFIDGMGQGIIFPVLSQALIDPHSHILLTQASQGLRNLWYGVLVGAFFACWFIGAAMLGDLSDSSGRKKALIVCLGGSVLGNFIAALAFSLHSVWLLLAGRVIVGFTNGSQPIAQAAIVDISPEKKLSRNLGLIVMAVTLGIIVGPLIGGFLSDTRLLFWFSDSVPLYFAALVAGINILLLLLYFQETSTQHNQVKIHLTRAFEIFISAFRHPSVRFLSICFIFLQIGWATYFVYISAYMTQKFSLNARSVSVFFALLGLGLSLGFAVLPGLIEKLRLNRKHVCIAGYGILLLVMGVTVFSSQIIWPWIAAFLAGGSVALGYSFLLTLYSQQVDKAGSWGSPAPLAAWVGESPPSCPRD